MGFLDWVARVNERLEPETVDTPVVPTDDDIANALDRTEELARDAQLPPLVLARVGRVTELVRATLPRLRSTGLNTSDSYAVMATATDYLPEALNAYLRLPRDWANSRPVEGGKTSLMLLVDQLDLLGATMAKILDAVARTDAAALIAHGRFLTERFGGTAPTRTAEPARPRSSNPLDLEGP
ncbi:hypothetical protein ACF3NT_06635 [Naumannella halotolerans]|uniref:Uncharacterized protein n=1 Tax=Naumannella halotolerans TaxID=993414 RepID=A0A4R7JAW2_9ACTN|nr:hypothetical protein [Naumannella halotolerans]TDT33713.1 hypothetical protein CLV29_1340 [Naumannella halotolerans]